MTAVIQNSKSGKIITIPNALSFLRILLMPFFIYFLSQNNGIIYVIILTVIMILSDFFDGYFARKFNQISNLGKIIDPVADKITIGAIIIALVYFRDFPVWAVGLIIFRDVLILLVGLYVIQKEKYVPVSNKLGKVTVTIYAVLLFAYALRLDNIKVYLLYISLVFLFLSLAGYYRVVFLKPDVNK